MFLSGDLAKAKGFGSPTGLDIGLKPGASHTRENRWSIELTETYTQRHTCTQTHPETHIHKETHTHRDTVKTATGGHHTFIHVNRQEDSVTSHMDPRHWTSSHG